MCNMHSNQSFVLKVIIGKALPAVAVPTPCLYKEGDFMCTDVPEYAGEWPQVCRVIAAEENHLIVQWYKGSKSTTWTPCTRRMKGQKGRTDPWVERVAREYVVHAISAHLCWAHPKENERQAG